MVEKPMMLCCMKFASCCVLMMMNEVCACHVSHTCHTAVGGSSSLCITLLYCRMAAIRALGTSICQPLVACNVYVSAGRLHHSDLLLGILTNAQKQCHLLRTCNKTEKVVVVHAFADGPYDRSSFHLAGSPRPVVAVACEIIRQAMDSLLTIPKHQTKDDENQSRHPFVGLVDHVSVMPLDGVETWSPTKARETSSDGTNDCHHSNTTTGNAAREIGSTMTELGVNVYYYGNAHPNKTPLATVRREQTLFFQSGSLKDSDKNSNNNNNKAGIATVGAPPTFVENFNIRLQSSKSTAQSLTKLVRERNGGLPGVEALTLAYGEGRFEVACNLLSPQVGSADVIKAKVKEWQSQLDNQDVIVEKAYRVGTTADQCLEALSLCESQETAIEHDKVVFQRLKEYLSEGPKHD